MDGECEQDVFDKFLFNQTYSFHISKVDKKNTKGQLLELTGPLESRQTTPGINQDPGKVE